MTANVTIYHNPECGTSRNTLALIRNAGIEPTIIYYLDTPPDQAQLRTLIADAHLTVQQAIRTNVAPYIELGLANEQYTDEQWLSLMVKHPLLINRPFVVTELGTCLARPSERVLAILAYEQKGAFIKEDGIKVVDDNGQPLN